MTNPLHIAATGLSATTYLAFAWGIWGVFIRKGASLRRLTVLKVGAVISAVAGVAAIWRAPVALDVGSAAGVGLYLFSLGLFGRCAAHTRRHRLSLAFSVDEPAHLYQDGPYRWVRHPFYAAYLTSYVAAILISRNPWLLAVIVGMWLIYFDAARLEERKFDRSPLKEAYARYQTRAGMLLPNPVKLLRHRPPA